MDVKWVVSLLLFFAAGLNYADRTAITSVFPLLQKEFGMSSVALGATGTVFLWSYAALSPFAGYWGDRMSRARLVTLSLGAWSVVMAASALAGSTTQLLTMRAILGIAEAAYIPAATALIADFHGPDTRAKAIGIHLAGFSAGMVGGGALAGYLGDHVGWRVSFVILGTAGLLLTAACALFLRDAKDVVRNAAAADSPSMIKSIVELVKIPSFVVLTLENVLSGTVMWIFINWLPLFFRETFGFSLAMAGLYGTLWYQGGRVAGVTIGGWPSDFAARKHSKYRMLLMAAAYSIAAPMLTCFAWTTSFAVIACCVAAFSIFVGIGYVNAQPLVCELLPERLRSTAIGMMNMTSCFVGGAGILIAGVLRDSFGLANAFSSLAAIEGTVGIMLLVTFLTRLARDLSESQNRFRSDSATGPTSAPAMIR